jgi:tetratricopeptide (TPR) repeat protein
MVMKESAAVDKLHALLRRGRYAELERFASEFVARWPMSGTVWKFLAGALAAQGKPAIPALVRAAHLSPHDAEAHSNLGNALAAAGDLDEAVASFRRALDIDPSFALLHRRLGNVLYELSRYPEAEKSYRLALDAEPEAADLHHRSGHALRACGRFQDALVSHRRAVELDPRHAGYRNDLGTALVDLGYASEAAAQFRSALELEPDFVQAKGNLGNALRYLGQFDGAEACYREVLAVHPNLVQAHQNLAVLLKMQNRLIDAKAHCQSALQIEPTSPAALALRARFYADEGRFIEAETLLVGIIARNPDSPEAWSGIPHLRQMRTDDAAWLDGALKSAQRSLPPSQEARLRFSIGKYFDDVQDYPKAFESYRRANELVKTCRPRHDMAALTRTVDFIIHSFGSAWASGSRGDGIRSTRPVFIVGMPRSGTTLAEQILAAHPAVCGANELGYWGAASAAYLVALSAGESVEGRTQDLATGYLRLLAGLSVEAQRVVDKMPVNFMSIGLIHAALPDAKFIHMHRNPIDTCLSIYFQDFDATYAFANDLQDLAHYYAEYVRIMAHWRSAISADRVLDVSYEELVDNPESGSRKMLEFIGLDWDPACLNFHQAHRTINTASNWQVRQKINKSSVERWRNYEPFIHPLMELARFRR